MNYLVDVSMCVRVCMDVWMCEHTEKERHTHTQAYTVNFLVTVGAPL